MISFRAIFDKLNEKGVQYLIVGGVAVNMYGYSRTTADIDILLSLDEKNLTAMDKAMLELKYYPRIPVQVIELANRRRIERYRLEKNLKAYTFTASGQPPLNVDIIIEESLEFEKFWKNRKDIDFYGQHLSVISLKDLIAMKKKADRNKDHEDLSALTAFHIDV